MYNVHQNYQCGTRKLVQFMCVNVPVNIDISPDLCTIMATILQYGTCMFAYRLMSVSNTL